MRYPIIAYQPRVDDIDTASSPSWLTAQDVRHLSLSWFDGLRVFDAAGFERVVSRARVVAERRGLLGIRREVDLVLDFEGIEQPVALTELVVLVSEAAETDSSLWEWSSDPTNKERFLARIHTARSHEELIRVLASSRPTSL